MYGGLVLSQNTQSYDGRIPVQYINSPSNAVVLPRIPPPVNDDPLLRADRRLRSPPSSFLATINLAPFAGKTGVINAPIDVTTPDSRVRILSYDPQFIDDPAGPARRPSRTCRSRSSTDPTPDGLTLGPTTIDPAVVTVSGAASIVDQVDSVRADVDDPVDRHRPRRGRPARARRQAGQRAPAARGHAGRRRAWSSPSSRTSRAGLCRSTPSSPACRRPASRSSRSRSSPQVVLVAGRRRPARRPRPGSTPSPISMTGVSEDETVEAKLALPTGVVAVDDVAGHGDDQDPAGDRHPDLHSRPPARRGRRRPRATRCRPIACWSRSAARPPTSTGCPGPPWSWTST